MHSEPTQATTARFEMSRAKSVPKLTFNYSCKNLGALLRLSQNVDASCSCTDEATLFHTENQIYHKSKQILKSGTSVVLARYQLLGVKQ